MRRGSRSAALGGLGLPGLLVAVSIAPLPAAEAVKLRPLVAIYVGASDVGLRAPGGVGCGEGVLAVADTGNGRILTYSVDADSVRPGAVLAVPQLPVPVGVAFLSGGELLVLDARSRRIARIRPTGELVGLLDPRGDVVGAVEVRSLAVGPQDRVYVLDVAGWRVLVLDPAGAVERSIAFPEQVGFLSDVAVDDRGDVYVVDSVARRVHVARAGEAALVPLTPSLVEDLDFPTSIDVDAEGRLFVADEHGGGVVILGRDGAFRGRQLSMGWRDGFLRYPSDVCVDSRGRLFVAERGNNRVQMFEIR
jgi:DNA-binding beta-propeller fold protein YncE